MNIGKLKARILWRITALFAVFALGQGVAPAQDTPPSLSVVVPPIVTAEGARILFIGNSLTGIPKLSELVSMLDASAPKPLRLKTGRESPGGQALLFHSKSPETQATLDKGWDVVVLQEASRRPTDERGPQVFHRGAQAMAARVRAGGARPVLYMTFPNRDKLQTATKLAEEYERVGQVLQVPVVPVGRVWMEALKRRPELRLYCDNVHPTPLGSYLIACVFHVALTGRQPETSGWNEKGFLEMFDKTIRTDREKGKDVTVPTAEDAIFLQRLAWEVVADYRAGHPLPASGAQPGVLVRDEEGTTGPDEQP